MSGKEKAEELVNDVDDFELDSLDEENWPDDASTDAAGAKELTPHHSGSEKASRSPKKSGGGLLSGLLLLAVLGGGSFYAYQADMIPGLSPSSTKVPAEASLPPEANMTENSPEALASQDNSLDVPLDSLPPSPETTPPEIAADSDPEPVAAVPSAPLEVGSASIEGSSDVLTPLPDLLDTSDSIETLPPLVDSVEGELEVAQVAEKDGMLLQDPANSLLDPEASVSTEAPLSPPGQLSESTDSASSGKELNEATLSQETEQVPLSGAFLNDDSLPSGSPQNSDIDADITPITQEVADSSPVQTESAPSDVAILPDQGEASKPETDVPANAAEDPALAEVANLVSENVSTVDGEDPLKTPAASTPDTGGDALVSSDPGDSDLPSEAISAPTEASDGADVPAPKLLDNKPEVAGNSAEPSITEGQSVKKTQVKPVVSPKWKLKSATPGTAVLFDSQTGDVKTVEVGDRVKGLGKIKSISLQKGKWVVQGTAGKISQ